MTNRSVRQVVKVSIGGDVIRLKLSNIYSMQPVEIRSIYIAHAKDSFAIDAKTAQYFKFGNSYKTVIPAGKQIVSDALKFNLRNLERVAITINYTSAPEVPTVHMGSRTTSYIMKGVTNAHSNFEKAFRENHWYNISGIDVYTMSNNMSAIAIIGNSITDGKCSTDNAQNRWPDVMSEMLQLKHKITNQGVLNLGIGNNRITVPGGFGALAKERFDRDILMQNGVKSANALIQAQKNSKLSDQIAEKYLDGALLSRLLPTLAHFGHSLKAYQETMLPFAQRLHDSEDRARADYARIFDSYFPKEPTFEDAGGWMSMTNVTMQYLTMEHPGGDLPVLVTRSHYVSFVGMLRGDFFEALRAGHGVRRCFHCNQWFLTTNAHSVKYCDMR